MAKNKVYIDVEVDDKGTTKKVAVDAKNLGNELDKTGDNSKKAAKGLEKTEKTSKKTRKAIRGVAQTASAGSKNFANMASGINGGLVPAYAVLAAQIFAVTAAFNFLKSAGTLVQLQAGQAAYAAATGTNFKRLAKDIQAATDSQISFRDAAQAGAIGTAAGLSTSQLTELGSAAKDVSAVLGRDVTDSFNRLVRGVTKAEPELLDELGIILRLKTATEDYKQALNITGELTAFQKTQAVTADALGQVEEKYSRLLEATGTTSNEFAKLAVSFETIVEKAQVFLAKGLAPLASFLAEFPALIIAAFLPFAGKVLSTAIPGVEKFGDALNETSDKYKKVAEKAKESSKRAETALKKQTVITKKEVRAQAQALQQYYKGNDKLLLTRAAKGEQLDKKKIDSLKRRLKKEGTLYKISNKQAIAELKLTLANMEKLNQQTVTRMGIIWARLPATVAAAGAGMVATFAGAMATMSAIAAKTSALLMTLFSWAGWIVLIGAIIGVVYAFLRTEKQLTKAEKAFQAFQNKVNDARESSDEFIRTQNIMNDTLERGNSALAAFGNRLSNIGTKELSEQLNKIIDPESLAKRIEQAKAAIDKYRNDLADSAKDLQNAIDDPTAGAGYNFSSLFVSNDKYRKGLKEELSELQEEIESSGLFKLAEDKSLSAGDFFTTEMEETLSYLGLVKKDVEGINNERFKENKVVKELLKSLESIDEGNLREIEDIQTKIRLTKELGSAIDQQAALQKDNTKQADSMLKSLVKMGEEDTLIQNLYKELSLTAKIQETNKELLEKEKDRAEVIEIQLNLFKSIADTQHNIEMASKKLSIFEEKALRGKTSLIKKEIKLRVNLARNALAIVDAEQKIAQAQEAGRKSRQEFLKIQTKRGEDRFADDQEEANFRSLEQANIARDRGLEQAREDLSLAKEKEKSLQRQLDYTSQIIDTASQAFESNLRGAINALITNQESSLKDSLLNIAKGVMTSVAGTVSDQLTKSALDFLKIGGKKTPEEKIVDALDNTGSKVEIALKTGGDYIAGKIREALGTADIPIIDKSTQAKVPQVPIGPSTEDKPTQEKVLEVPKGPSVEKPLNSGQGFFVNPKDMPKHMIAGSQFEGVSTKTEPSIFQPLKDLFSKDAPFLQKIGDIFSSFKDGFASIFKGLFSGEGGIGSLLGSLGSGIRGLLPFASGGIIQGGMKAYSSGGVVSKPTLGLIGEGRHNEAVVPLPNGKEIPVNLGSTGGAGTNNVAVNISMEGGQATTEGGSQNISEFGNVIASLVQRELADQTRPGGLLAK